VGEPEPRTILTGLKKFCGPEELMVPPLSPTFTLSKSCKTPGFRTKNELLLPMAKTQHLTPPLSLLPFTS